MLVPGPARSQPQQTSGAEADRLLRREIVIERDAAGNFRVIESLALRSVEDDSGRAGSVRLFHLPAGARALRSIGSDLIAGHLAQDGRTVQLFGPAPREPFALTYVLPGGLETFDLSSPLPTDSLMVAIARGHPELRASPALEVDEDESSGRYEVLRAADLARDSVLRLQAVRAGTDWRQRLAVLLATLIAATVAFVRVWRSGRAGA